MEELDLLKSTWKKNEFPKIPRMELYGMIHKQSSSTAKWILIISLLEIAFWVMLAFSFGGDTEGTDRLDALNIDAVFSGISFVSYGILIAFCALIYRAYRKIKILDNAKSLMANILHIRKIVSWYILFNIILIVCSLSFIFAEFFRHDPQMVEVFEKARAYNFLNRMYLLAVAIVTVCIAIISAAAWLFYKMLYGWLLRKLKKNYDELKNII